MAAIPTASRRFRLLAACLTLSALLGGISVTTAGQPPPAPVKNEPAVRWPDDVDNEEAPNVEVTAEVRARVLQAIFILNLETNTVTTTPKTEKDTKEPHDNPHSTGGEKTPHAPEPASLVLGLVGSTLALMTGVVRRRKRAAAETV